MGIREQRAGRLISYSATALSLLLAFYIYGQGKTDARKYLASMNVNHHSSYGGGKDLACSQCHVAELSIYGVGLKGGPITCSTTNCHGELLPETTREQAVEMYANSKSDENFFPYFAAQTQHHLDLHEAVNTQSCISCHTEHSERELIYPEGFVPFDSIKSQFQTNTNQSITPTDLQVLATLFKS
ncbi:MAG: hypothetical protein ACFCU1_04740 [Sumerlaeia bacterium]